MKANGLAPPFSGGEELGGGPELPPAVGLLEKIRPNYNRVIGRQDYGYEGEAWLEWRKRGDGLEDLEAVFDKTFEPFPRWGTRVPVLGDVAPELPILSFAPDIENFSEIYEDAFSHYAGVGGDIPRKNIPDMASERDALAKQINHIGDHFDNILSRAADLLKVLIEEVSRNHEGTLRRGKISWARDIWFRLSYGNQMLYNYEFGADSLNEILSRQKPIGSWSKKIDALKLPNALIRQQKIGLLYCIQVRNERIHSARPFEGRRRALDWLLYYGMKGEKAPFRDEIGAIENSVDGRTQRFAEMAFPALTRLRERGIIPTTLDTLWEEVQKEIARDNPEEAPPSTSTIRNWLWAKVPGGGFDAPNHEKWDFVVGIIERLGRPDS